MTFQDCEIKFRLLIYYFSVVHWNKFIIKQKLFLFFTRGAYCSVNPKTQSVEDKKSNYAAMNQL